MLTTTLDTFHSRMIADQDDDAARLHFYGALADTELFILLTHEAAGDNISPEILELEGDKYTLVFDREERLAEFTKAPAPYAALPGRVIAGMLAGQNIGMGLNLGVAPSSILIPAEAMEWLTQALAENPAVSTNAQASPVAPLNETLSGLVPILAEKLKFAGGLIKAAYLAQSDADTAILGCFDVPETAHPDIARAAQETLTFAGITGQKLDVVFVASNSTFAQSLIQHGTKIKVPVRQSKPMKVEHIAPGSDPTKPPILR